MPNFAVCSKEEGLFACLHCGDRRFKDLNGLYDHCRNAGTHSREWCEKCKRLFASEQALQQHKSSSSDHNECRFCGIDVSSSRTLRHHEWESHQYCRHCNAHFESVSVAPADHEEMRHFVCWDCDKQCNSYHNLRQVWHLVSAFQ